MAQTFNLSDIDKPKPQSTNSFHVSQIDSSKINPLPNAPAGSGEIRPRTFSDTLHNYGIPTTINDFLDKLSFVTRAGASMASSGAVGLATGGNEPAMAGTYGLVDELLRKVTGEPSGTLSGSENPLISVPESALESYATGKIINKVAPMVKGAVNEISKPGSVVGDALAKAKLTFSQYGYGRKVSQGIEDILNPAGKKAALDEQRILSKTEAESLIKKITTRKVTLDSTSSEHLALLTQNELQNQFEDSVKNTTSLGEDLKLQAASKPTLITTPNTSPSVNSWGQMIPNVPIVTKIEGATPLTQTVAAAKSFLADFEAGLTKFDVDSPAYKTAQNIISSTEDGAKPISFKQAWEWKKQAGEFAYGSPGSDLNQVDAKFKPIFFALDNDIESGAKDWGGKSAVKQYQKIKDLVNERHELFNPGGQSDSVTHVLLNNVDSSGNFKDLITSKIDQIIANRPLLQRTLNIGRMDIGAGPVKVSTDIGLRKDLAAFKLKRMFEANRVPDSNGLAGSNSPLKFDTTKLYQDWKNAELTDVHKLLFSPAQQSQIGQFLKILSLQDQKMISGGSNYLKMRAATSSVYLGSALIKSLMTGQPEAGLGGIAGGVITGGLVGLHYIGRALTNPDIARVLQGAAQGGPLSMSERTAAKVLANGLRGAAIDLIFSNGKTLPAMYNAQGQIELTGETK